MKHVVIGGNGFTGRLLVDELIRRGESVLVCDNDASSTRKTEECAADFQVLDIEQASSVATLDLQSDDVVHMLAARQYHSFVPKKQRNEFFDAVNVTGTRNVLERMHQCGASKAIFFSTDMVYGYPQSLPIDTNHTREPLGPYGLSKFHAEAVCREYRDKGFQITIFRPRMIVGPGRLGVLEKLFKLIEKNLPVPLIGNGSNHYQMVSVFDCVSAITCALDKGIPNDEFNLGSENPPTVHELLSNLINSCESRSFLLKTPAPLVKGVLDVLDKVGITVLFKEQYAISDHNYLVDIEKTKRELGWNPQHNDSDMFQQTFRDYKSLTA